MGVPGVLWAGFFHFHDYLNSNAPAGISLRPLARCRQIVCWLLHSNVDMGSPVLTWIQSSQTCCVMLLHPQVAMPRDFGERFWSTAARPRLYGAHGWLQLFNYIDKFCYTINRSLCYSPPTNLYDVALINPLTVRPLA